MKRTCKYLSLGASAVLIAMMMVKILTVEPLKNFGTPQEIVNIFGGKSNYLAAIKELEAEIYRAA